MAEETSLRDEPTIDVAPQSDWIPAINILSGDRVGQIVELKGESFTIGRTRGNSLQLNHKAVSRRHAVIELKDKRFILHDLESRWGVKVNGKDTKEASLKYGDEIEVAGIRLKLDLVLKDKIFKEPNRWLRRTIIILFIAAALSAVTLLYFRQQSKDDLERPGADILSQIIYHYDQGISYYNKMTDDKSNKDKVMKEMQKVIELDPKGTTQFSRSARRIIDGLER